MIIEKVGFWISKCFQWFLRNGIFLATALLLAGIYCIATQKLRLSDVLSSFLCWFLIVKIMAFLNAQHGFWQRMVIWFICSGAVLAIPGALIVIDNLFKGHFNTALLVVFWALIANTVMAFWEAVAGVDTCYAQMILAVCVFFFPLFIWAFLSCFVGTVVIPRLEKLAWTSLPWLLPAFE